MNSGIRLRGVNRGTKLRGMNRGARLRGVKRGTECKNWAQGRDQFFRNIVKQLIRKFISCFYSFN